jgi:hypothetical protein
VRYADDFVALARQWKPELGEYIESKLEGKFQLEINRDKTRVVDLREKGASLDFLGYTFRQDRDLKGREKRYLNVFPSKKAVQREREKAARDDQQSSVFQADPGLDRRAQSASEGLGQLILVWIRTERFTGRSTGTCVADSSAICKGAVRDPSGRRRGCRGIGTSKSSDWCTWGVPPMRGECMPETRVFRRAGRGKSASPARRGESGSR